MARIDVVPIIHAGWAAVLLPGSLKERMINCHALLQGSYSIPPCTSVRTYLPVPIFTGNFFLPALTGFVRTSCSPIGWSANLSLNSGRSDPFAP